MVVDTTPPLADRLREIATQIRLLHPPERRDPEAFWHRKSEIAAGLVALAAEAERRMGSGLITSDKRSSRR